MRLIQLEEDVWVNPEKVISVCVMGSDPDKTVLVEFEGGKLIHQMRKGVTLQETVVRITGKL